MDKMKKVPEIRFKEFEEEYRAISKELERNPL